MIDTDQSQAITWRPETPALARAIPLLAEQAQRGLPYGMHSTLGVGTIEIEQANATAFFGASPHTDRDFDRWFTMLVVKAPEGMVLHTAKRRSQTDNPKAAVSVNLLAGEILLFDAHRLHWVDPVEGVDRAREGFGWQFHEDLMKEFGEHIGVLVGTETRKRPTRQEAETLLCDYLRTHTPKCWAQAIAEPKAQARRMRR